MKTKKTLDFGYYGNVRIQYETYSLNIAVNYIKTDKAFYTSTITNKVCLKYEDIECKYEYEKLTDISDEIYIYIGNSTYITKDRKIYQLND